MPWGALPVRHNRLLFGLHKLPGQYISPGISGGMRASKRTRTLMVFLSLP